MPRLPEITSKADLPEDKQYIFDSITETRGSVGVPFSLLLHSPEVAGRIAHLGTYLRFGSAVPPGERELAVLTCAREFDCEYEWSAYVLFARRAGVREEVIDVIAHRRPLDSLTEDEALIVSYARELLHDHRVSDATFKAAKARYGNLGLTDLTATIGFYSMTACAFNAFGVQAPSTGARLP